MTILKSVADTGTAPTEFRLAAAAELRAMMARKSVSQVEMAAALGVTQPYVSRRVRGTTPIDVEDLAKFAQVLECSVFDLLPSAGGGTNRYYVDDVAARVLGRLIPGQLPDPRDDEPTSALAA